MYYNLNVVLFNDEEKFFKFKQLCCLWKMIVLIMVNDRTVQRKLSLKTLNDQMIAFRSWQHNRVFHFKR